MRLIYCEPSLTSYAGHWASYSSAVVSGFKELGIETHVFSSSRIHDELLKKFSAFKVFSISPQANLSNDPLCGPLKNYLDVADIFFRDLLKAKGITTKDCLYFEANSPAALRGIILWTNQQGVNAPRVIISLNDKPLVKVTYDSDHKPVVSQIGINPALWRLSSLSIDSIVASRIQFITCESIFADIYPQLLDKPVHLLPHPFSKEKSQQSKSSPFTVGFIGFQAPPKRFPSCTRYRRPVN